MWQFLASLQNVIDSDANARKKCYFFIQNMISLFHDMDEEGDLLLVMPLIKKRHHTELYKFYYY